MLKLLFGSIGALIDSKQSNLNVSIGHSGSLIPPQLTLTEKVIYNLFLIVIGAGVGGGLAYLRKRREKQRRSEHYKKRVRQVYEKSFVKKLFEETKQGEKIDDLYVKLVLLPQKEYKNIQRQIMHSIMPGSYRVGQTQLLEVELASLHGGQLEAEIPIDEDKLFQTSPIVDDEKDEKRSKQRSCSGENNICSWCSGCGKNYFL